MSGICGILRLDGGPVAAEDIDGLTGALKRRGPDGSSAWRSGEVALGHSLLATTPEALTERLPLTDAKSGCTITADVRLDNREELIEALGLGGERRVIGDGELILRSYLRWAEDCPKHLLGDFAFAIWDSRSRRLFCARDHMGMRRFSYHHRPGGIFVFATEAEAVLSHREVPRRINETRIADFLDGMEGADLTSTLFADIQRLPPAHSLTVGSDGGGLRRYWELTLPPILSLPNDEAYAAAFREVFSEAVRCRLRSAGPVGAMVSGGLDSSSAAVLAARLLGPGELHSFSAIGPAWGECRETQAIQSVIASGAFAATTVNFADLDGYQDELVRALEEAAEPFDAQMNLVRAVYLAARRQGVNVVLDGVGGDLAMTCGNRIAQLIREMRPIQALAEARREAHFWGHERSAAHLFVAALWAGLAPPPVRRLRQAIQAWREDRKAMAGRAGLTRDFAARIGLAARRVLYRRHQAGASATGKTYQLLAITHPHTAAARERYDRVASRFGVEPRDPFLDIRVLSFCLSLPPEQLRSGGWTKLVLRRAMAGLLPADVAWRQGKDHLGLDFTKALIAANPLWRDRWPAAFARVDAMAAAPVGKLAAVPDDHPQHFIEIFSLSCWLSRHDV